MMNVLVIDGQGGGLGKLIVENIKKTFNDAEITAAGTNAMATAAMLKAGADAGATGENAICYNAGRANIIAGPLGICLPNAMHGEISPAMANAICRSEAVKILIPISKCNVSIAGAGEKPLGQYMADMIDEALKDGDERAGE